MIRPAVPADARRIAEMAASLTRDPADTPATGSLASDVPTYEALLRREHTWGWVHPEGFVLAWGAEDVDPDHPLEGRVLDEGRPAVIRQVGVVRPGEGIGRALYVTAILALKALDYTHVYAAVVVGNDASMRFHEQLGFSKVLGPVPYPDDPGRPRVLWGVGLDGRELPRLGAGGGS